MSTITRVSVHSYTYALENFGPNLMTYQKGGSLELTKFVAVIETDDGLRGEYAPHYMASAKTCAQVIEMAPLLLGRDAEERTKIYEDLKITFRHYDRAGAAALDGALWDLAGLTPVPIRGNPPPEALIASGLTLTSRSTALSLVIPLSRSTAFGTAPLKARSRWADSWRPSRWAAPATISTSSGTKTLTATPPPVRSVRRNFAISARRRCLSPNIFAGLNRRRTSSLPAEPTFFTSTLSLTGASPRR